MGLLPERWELVQGEIISKMGTNLPHSMIAKRIDTWLSAIFPTDRILPTCSIDVAPEDNPTSEPEPDITIIDRQASLYGRAGVPEYWVVDIKARRIHQHREPNADGYGSVRVVEAGEFLSPLARPDAALTPGLILS